ncbi:MAG: DUF2849 domain-containing protein [Alphaproteobacteria bacterium]|jgi:hypothetical protein|nr:DUF2849 domain-containing protein [Alphaproteobacteria bacterium]
MARKIATANRIADGRVVYLGAHGAWHETMAEARVADDETAAADLDAAARLGEVANLVIGAYLIEVEGRPLRPARLRERIRAAGPTVQVELNRPPTPIAAEWAHVSL